MQARTGISRKLTQFSMASLMLWFVIACLVVSHVLTGRRLDKLRRDFDTQQQNALLKHPIPLDQVRRQFERASSPGPIKSSVNDATYSTDLDSIKIDYTWNVSTINTVHRAVLILESDGYGAYVGRINDDSFLLPLGSKNSWPIVVRPAKTKTDSARP